MDHSTAAILLIGNELLSGKVADENIAFLTKELFSRGLQVRRIVIVPDEIDVVRGAINELLELADVLLTSGGIGPTHDDITVEAVALALDRPLELDPDLVERAKTLFGKELEAAHLKMATIPRGATLVESDETRWPALVVDRVFVLAGVPTIMRRAFRAVSGRLPSSAAQAVATVYLLTDEWTLTPLLHRVVEAAPDVQVGSYPVIGDPEYRVRVTLEGDDRGAVERAKNSLVEGLPEDQVVRVEGP